MEATCFAISQATRNRLNNSVNITTKRRSEIRKDGVRQLIRSVPAHTPIKVKNLMKAAGYNVEKAATREYYSGMSFINTLRKKGNLKSYGNNSHNMTWVWFENPTTKPVLTAKVEVKEVPITLNISQIAKKKNTPIKFKKREAVEPVYTTTEELQDAMVPKKNIDNSYSFTFTLDKASDHGEFGKKRVANIEINSTNVEHILDMIKNIVQSNS